MFRTSERLPRHPHTLSSEILTVNMTCGEKINWKSLFVPVSILQQVELIFIQVISSSSSSSSSTSSCGTPFMEHGRLRDLMPSWVESKTVWPKIIVDGRKPGPSRSTYWALSVGWETVAMRRLMADQTTPEWSRDGSAQVMWPSRSGLVVMTEVTGGWLVLRLTYFITEYRHGLHTEYAVYGDGTIDRARWYVDYRGYSHNSSVCTIHT